jgi:hypothetical protein
MNIAKRLQNIDCRHAIKRVVFVKRPCGVELVSLGIKLGPSKIGHVMRQNTKTKVYHIDDKQRARRQYVQCGYAISLVPLYCGMLATQRHSIGEN